MAQPHSQGLVIGDAARRRLISGTVTTLATAASASFSDSTFGLTTGDMLAVYTRDDLAGGAYQADVSAANTVRVRNAGNTSLASRGIIVEAVRLPT